MEVNNFVETNGIRTAHVRARIAHKITEKAAYWHYLVAFETVDRGIIFIELQSDMEGKIVIGEPFPWHLVGKAHLLGYNDPIVEIQILW